MTQKGRYQVITWQRGSHQVLDTKYEIGDPRRGGGAGKPGYKLRREAEAVARRKNREAEEGTP